MALVYTMSPGQREVFFNALTPTTEQKSTPMVVPKCADGGTRTITWEETFTGGAPANNQIQLQGAMTDTEAEYALLDEATDVADFMRTYGPLNVNFIRFRQVSRGAGGTSVTVKATIS
jgi:hypothetical protein